MIDGCTKADPAMNKKPQLKRMSQNISLIWDIGLAGVGSTLAQSLGDLALIVFYYLLHIGEYTVKWSQNRKKQTVQFKLEDISFFEKDKLGTLMCLSCTAPLLLLLMADSATLKLDNQKNGWKGVCVHHEANGELFKCPIRALAWRVIHFRENKADGETFLSAYFVEGKRFDVKGEDISKGLKMAATVLDYPALRGIPILRINTHSLQSRGANALVLSDYSDTKIK